MKLRPYMFLLILIILIIFILGVRYGQRVEKNNKVIEWYLTRMPTPTAPVIPTVIEIDYDTYKDKTCGVSFLYPKNLKTESSTASAVFKSSDGTTELTLQCDRQQNKLISQLDTAKLATKEMTFKQQQIQAREGQLNTGKSMVGFTIRNPINNEFVLFNLNKNLYPLIEKTLQFE